MQTNDSEYSDDVLSGYELIEQTSLVISVKTLAAAMKTRDDSNQTEIGRDNALRDEFNDCVADPALLFEVLKRSALGAWGDVSQKRIYITHYSDFAMLLIHDIITDRIVSYALDTVRVLVENQKKEGYYVVIWFVHGR